MCRRCHQPVETFQYQCSFCTKRFPHVSLLNIHLRVHTGEKPFQCIDCGQCFGSQSSLIKHNRYQCTDCCQCFGSQSSLIKHNRYGISAQTAASALGHSPHSSNTTGISALTAASALVVLDTSCAGYRCPFLFNQKRPIFSNSVPTFFYWM